MVVLPLRRTTPHPPQPTPQGDAVKRLIIIEIAANDSRDFAEILNGDDLRGQTIHLAIGDAAEAVLAALPHLHKEIDHA
jgi:hypothetical protein